MNADDFGLSKGTNRGIASAFNNGILRSTSLMPNGSAFEDAVKIASETPGLGVGIHVSLVGENCLADLDDVRGLASADGSLPKSYGAFSKAYATKRFSLAAVRAEIVAQVQRALDAGIKPTHIDSHQHLHVMPGIIDVVIDVACSAGIKVIRVPAERGGVNMSPLSPRGAQLWVLTSLSRVAARKAQKTGLSFVDHFWGLGVSGKMNETNLLLTLDRLGSGVNEVMCHPGFGDCETAEKYQWGYSWDDEAAALHSDAIRNLIDERHIRLSSFGDAFL